MLWRIIMNLTNLSTSVTEPSSEREKSYFSPDYNVEDFRRLLAIGGPDELAECADALRLHHIAPITQLTRLAHDYLSQIFAIERRWKLNSALSEPEVSATVKRSTEIIETFSGKPYYWDCWLINGEWYEYCGALAKADASGLRERRATGKFISLNWRVEE